MSFGAGNSVRYMMNGFLIKLEFAYHSIFLTLFLRFRGLQPGIRRNSFYGKHLYEVVREVEITPQLSATQGIRVILAN